MGFELWALTARAECSRIIRTHLRPTTWQWQEGWRGDAGRMKGRCGKDGGEMREGWRGDVGRMEGRCGKDGGEMREG